MLSDLRVCTFYRALTVSVPGGDLCFLCCRCTFHMYQRCLGNPKEYFVEDKKCVTEEVN